MKQQLTEFVRDVDQFCARLNGGLTAVAIMLGFLVMVMSIIRAQDYMPDFITQLPSGYQLPMGN